MKTKETKIITEGKGTQVAPKQTPAEKEAAKQQSSDDQDPQGAPPPRKILKEGKPAVEGAPVKSTNENDNEADLNQQNSEENNQDPSQSRRSGTEYGRGL